MRVCVCVRLFCQYKVKNGQRIKIWIHIHIDLLCNGKKVWRRSLFQRWTPGNWYALIWQAPSWGCQGTWKNGIFFQNSLFGSKTIENPTYDVIPIKEKLQISNRMVWTLRRCICIVHANSYLRNTQSTSDVQRSPTVLGFGKNSTQPHLRLSCFQQTHCTWSGVTSINHLRILTRQYKKD